MRVFSRRWTVSTATQALATIKDGWNAQVHDPQCAGPEGLIPVATPARPLDAASLRALATRTHLAAGTMLVVTATFIIAKTGRDALYFANGGILDLPKAYIGMALLALPVAACALGLMRTIGPRRSRIVAPLGIALMLAWFALTAHPGGGRAMTTFFMLVPLTFAVLFSMFWLLAADLLQGTPSDLLARAYREIGAASILGGVLGGVLARALSSRVEPSTLVLLAAGLLVLAAAGMAAIQQTSPPGGLRCFSQAVHAAVDHNFHVATPQHLGFDPVPAAIMHMPPTDAARVAWSGARDLLRDRYATRLLVVGMLAAAVGVLIEFQFYMTVAAMAGGSRDRAGVFANAYLLVNALALALQLWVLPRLQRTIGASGALLVLPGVLLGGGVAMLASAAAVLRAAVRVAEGGFKSSIHRTSWEQAFLPFDRGRRSVAKLVVDATGTPVAEGLTGGALLLWTRGASHAAQSARPSGTLLAISIIGCTILWLVATRGIRNGVGSQHTESERDLISAACPLPGH
jgi:ATP/ADP translocase